MSKDLFPSSVQPLVGAGGIITTPWHRFFNALIASPSAVETVQVSGSPLTYKASQRGNLVVTGGTVTLISFNRARATIDIPGGAPLIPMANDDEVTVTYSSAPTISFIPT